MKKWIVAFAVIGFLGASAFYSPYIGLDGQSFIECPFCPNVTIISGTPLQRFFRLTLIMGVLNAILFAGLASLVILSARTFQRIAQTRRLRPK
jgi:hypothetical protein